MNIYEEVAEEAALGVVVIKFQRVAKNLFVAFALDALGNLVDSVSARNPEVRKGFKILDGNLVILIKTSRRVYELMSIR